MITPVLLMLNLAVPDEEALKIGPAPAWLRVKADWPEEVASTASISSISTAPLAVVTLLLFVSFWIGLFNKISPLPSGVTLTLPLLPAVVLRLRTFPAKVKLPPVAEKVGLALPPIVKLPLLSRARTTFCCVAPAAVIGRSPWSVSELAAKATVAIC